MKNLDIYHCDSKDVTEELELPTRDFYNDILKNRKAYLAVFFHHVSGGANEKRLMVQIVHGHDIEKDLPIVEQDVRSGHWEDVRKGLETLRRLTRLEKDPASYDDKSVLSIDHQEEPLFIPWSGCVLHPCAQGKCADSVSSPECDRENVINLKRMIFKSIGRFLKSEWEPHPDTFTGIQFFLLRFDGCAEDLGSICRNYISIFTQNDTDAPNFSCVYTRLQKESLLSSEKWESEIRRLLSSPNLLDVFYGYDEMRVMLEENHRWVKRSLGISGKTDVPLNKKAPETEKQEKLHDIFTEFFLRHISLPFPAFQELFFQIVIAPTQMIIKGFHAERADDAIMVNYGIAPWLIEKLRSRLTVNHIIYLENLAESGSGHERLLAYVLLPRLNPRYANEIYRKWAVDFELGERFKAGFSSEVERFLKNNHKKALENVLTMLELEWREDFYEILVREYLHDPDYATRVIAINLLAEACERGQIEKVNVMDVDFLFYDENCSVKEAILENITRICNPGVFVYEGIETLCHDEECGFAYRALERNLEVRGPTAPTLRLLIPHLSMGFTDDTRDRWNFLFYRYCSDSHSPKKIEQCEGCLDVILSMLNDPRVRHHAIVAMVWIGRPENLPLLRKLESTERLYPRSERWVREWLRRAIQTLEGDVDGLMEDFKKIKAHAMIKGSIFSAIVKPAMERARLFAAQKQSKA